MCESINQKLIETLKSAELQVNRLVLIVGTFGSGKSTVINNLAKLYNSKPINVNLRLSEMLLELTEKERQLRLSKITTQLVSDLGERVFLDNIEILFDVNLRNDPLRLLKELSRNLTIVATWNGIYKNNKLTYSEPGHNEYQKYELTDTLVFTTNQEYTDVISLQKDEQI